MKYLQVEFFKYNAIIKFNLKTMTRFKRLSYFILWAILMIVALTIVVLTYWVWKCQKHYEEWNFQVKTCQWIFKLLNQKSIENSKQQLTN